MMNLFNVEKWTKKVLKPKKKCEKESIKTLPIFFILIIIIIMWYHDELELINLEKKQVWYASVLGEAG